MILASLLIGIGIIAFFVGVHFLRAHHNTHAPNEELEWMGFGDHPFRKKK